MKRKSRSNWLIWPKFHSYKSKLHTTNFCLILRTRPKFRYILKQFSVYVFCNQQRFSLLSYLEGSLRCNSSSIMKMQFSFINGEVCLAHIWVKRSQWMKTLSEGVSDFSQYFGSIFMDVFRKKKNESWTFTNFLTN